MRISTALLVLSLVAGMPIDAATAYTITLNGFHFSRMTTYARGGTAIAAQEGVNPAGLAYSSTSTSIQGAASSESIYALDNDGFDITFDHSKPAASGSYTRSYGFIYFNPDENINYTASGSYTAVDPDGTRVLFFSRLFDYTADSYLYRSEQRSESTVNESFTLGLSGGDAFNYSEGALTSTLIAGHDYQFYYDAFVINSSLAATAVSAASGSVSLDFTAVPEPGTAVLVTMGLVGLVARRRRSN